MGGPSQKRDDTMKNEAQRDSDAKRKQKQSGNFRRERLPSPTAYYPAHGQPLGGRGRWRSTRCPFHNDRNPSLRVNPETGGYICMSCGEKGGDVLSFHRRRHGLSFVEAAKALGAWEEDPGSTSTSTETPEQAVRRLAARAIKDGFQFEALHVYKDLQGQVLYWRIRLRHPETREKWIRPMYRDDKRGYRIGEPTFVGEKPLYGLERLAARPRDPVVICEGESCIDALTKVGVLALTSGGADSAEKACWEPIYGREILIWPDHDDAGQRYAEAVAAKLLSANCSVRIIDVESLGLERKQDAVDWLCIHSAATAAEILALPSRTATSEESAPVDIEHTSAVETQQGSPEELTCFYDGGRFLLSEDGVRHEMSGEAPRWICGWLRVEALVRDANSRQWGRLLAVRDADGVQHRWSMSAEALVGDGLDVLRELVGRGLTIALGRREQNLLLAYIQLWPTKVRARVVDKLGWHGNVYATPSGGIGGADEEIVYQGSSSQTGFSESGTVEQWRESVSRLAQGNTRVVFAISIAFAGPLGHLAGEDSGGFHFRGTSSGGKTTSLKASASVWGKPSAYIRLWRSTANGLEGLAAQHNDGLLVLDEISQIDPREAGEAAYLLANGKGKARATRTGEARQSASWRLLFLSSGEESLAALLTRAGKRSNAGQEIRLADIEADAGRGLGIFECLHELPSSAQFADAISDAAAQHHGCVGREWLKKVVADSAQLRELISRGIHEFVTEVVPVGASGQIERVARRFGLVAVAGELATHYGLTGWQEGEADRAAKACFATWLEGFGGIGNREERTLLAQVRAFFDQHGASRFQHIEDNTDTRIINRVGFWRETESDTREHIVLSEAFRTDLCAGFDSKAAARILIQHGWLIPDNGRSTQRVRLPGMGQVRVYVFSSAMWEAE